MTGDSKFVGLFLFSHMVILKMAPGISASFLSRLAITVLVYEYSAKYTVTVYTHIYVYVCVCV